MNGISHLIFDFFGTLVTRPAHFNGVQAHRNSWLLLKTAGLEMDYSQFLCLLTETSSQLGEQHQPDLREYSIEALIEQFCCQHLSDASPSLQRQLVNCYVSEWSVRVQHPLEVAAMLHRLQGHYRLAIICNCHHQPIIDFHLKRLGVDDLFDAVITSVETGWRKPHPAIFEAALQQLDCAPQDCLFIGDNYLDDYIGASRAGMQSWLIDPQAQHPVPASERLRCVMGAETRLLRARMACA